VDLRWDQIELARANTYASASPGVFYYPDRKWQHVPDGMTYTFTREGAPQIDAREKPQTFQWQKRNPQILPLRPLGSTRPLKGLVNSLNFHKNTKKALLAQIWHSEVELWQHCESADE